MVHFLLHFFVLNWNCAFGFFFAVVTLINFKYHVMKSKYTPPIYYKKNPTISMNLWHFIERNCTCSSENMQKNAIQCTQIWLFSISNFDQSNRTMNHCVWRRARVQCLKEEKNNRFQSNHKNKLGWAWCWNSHTFSSRGKKIVDDYFIPRRMIKW